MTPFALPYDPDAAPVLWIIGHGFTPAWQPADYIGPRMDCPMWVPAPDADVALIAKVPPALAPVEPYGHLTSWGTVLPEMPVAVAQPSAAELAGPVATVPWHPVAAPPAPWWPSVPPIWWPTMPPPAEHPCQCIVPPPGPELPPLAPVSVEAGAGAFLIVAICALAAWKAWAAMGAFGDWFTAERGNGPHQNGWI